MWLFSPLRCQKVIRSSLADKKGNGQIQMTNYLPLPFTYTKLHEVPAVLSGPTLL